MINQPQIPMTARDFHLTLYEFLRPGGFLEQRFGADAVKFRDHEIGMMLIELIAGMSGVFSYAVGREGQEGNILTARETQSVIDEAAALGYPAFLPTSATIGVRIRFNNYNGQLILPETFSFGTDPAVGEQVVFELPNDVQKQNGVQTLEATFVQGETIVEEMVISSGNIRDRIELVDGPVSRDSSVVLVDGVAWQEVSQFIDSSATSEHFRIVIVEHVPGERKYLVEFGDNKRGKYPPPGTAVQVSYRKGGGTIGNVPSEIVGTPLVPVVAPDGSFVNVTIEAIADGTGGLDEETIDEIRLNAVIASFTNQRTVSDGDYALATRVHGGLKRAIVLTSNIDPTIPENMILVLGTKTLDSTLTQSEADTAKAAVVAALPNGGTNRFIVGPCAFEAFSVHVEVRAFRTASLVDVDSESRLITENLLSLDGLLGIEENIPRFILDIGEPVDQGAVEKELFKIPHVKSVRVIFNGLHTAFSPSNNRTIPTPSVPTYDIDFEG